MRTVEPSAAARVKAYCASEFHLDHFIVDRGAQLLR
jgi:hypothetical protein